MQNVLSCQIHKSQLNILSCFLSFAKSPPKVHGLLSKFRLFFCSIKSVRTRSTPATIHQVIPAWGEKKKNNDGKLLFCSVLFLLSLTQFCLTGGFSASSGVNQRNSRWGVSRCWANLKRRLGGGFWNGSNNRIKKCPLSDVTWACWLGLLQLEGWRLSRLFLQTLCVTVRACLRIQAFVCVKTPPSWVFESY